jgi:hypothetical protein
MINVSALPAVSFFLITVTASPTDLIFFYDTALAPATVSFFLITVTAPPTALIFFFLRYRAGSSYCIVFLNNRDGTTDGFNFSFYDTALAPATVSFFLITVTAPPTVIIFFLFYDTALAPATVSFFLTNRDGTTDGFNFNFFYLQWNMEVHTSKS